MSAGTLVAWNVNQRSGLRQLENEMRTHISQVQVAAYTTAKGTQTDGVVLTTLKSTRTPGWLPTSVNSGPRRNRCVVAGVVSTLTTRWRSVGCTDLRASRRTAAVCSDATRARRTGALCYRSWRARGCPASSQPALRVRSACSSYLSACAHVDVSRFEMLNFSFGRSSGDSLESGRAP